MKKYLLSTVFMLIISAATVSYASGMRMFVVNSGSMEPELKTGDIVVTRPQAAYSLGETITYQSEQSQTTHKIVSVVRSDTNQWFRTKGEANELEDKGLVSPDAVIGKVVAVIPGLGMLLMLPKRAYLLLMIWLICSIVLVMELAQLQKAIRKLYFQSFVSQQIKK